MGAWHDVGWWQLELQRRVGTPLPPRPLAETQEHPEWEPALHAGELR